MKAGPLTGLKVVELAGLAPAPFACTLLADLGADVIRVDRAAEAADVLRVPADPLSRGRRTIGVNTKTDEGVELVLRLADSADVLIEGFRPGVAERMGLGPTQVHTRNPRLVYGRITGWGQDGPLAPAAGHDINYIAISGALDPIGRAGERPIPPLNLLGDFGGGGLLLAMGVLAALYERGSSGRGQVVDASMVDGAALLTTQLHGLRAAGMWPGKRGENMLDGGAPFYDTYETADGKYIAVGALEMRFWADLVKVLGLNPEKLPVHLDQSEWPRLREILTESIGKYSSRVPRGPTPASLRCFHLGKPPNTRTTRHVAPSSRSAGWSSRRRRPGSTALPRTPRKAPTRRARTRRRSSASTGSTQPRSVGSGRPVWLPRGCVSSHECQTWSSHGPLSKSESAPVRDTA
jgi:alpha-methylacyl-CoA racemase